MRLSHTVAYAVHAALRLAKAPEASAVSCKDLAEQGKMPERFLLLIVRDLVKRGIVETRRGGKGGYALARRPDEISLLEVIEAVEGPMAAALPLKSDLPHPAGERLHDALRKVTEGVRRELQPVSLSDLLEMQDAKESTSKSAKRAKRR